MVNQCNFIGNLGSDVEKRATQSGDSVANFSLACTEKWKDGERTEWVRVVAFGKLADICSDYLSKGSKAYISGRMQTRSWEDRDGNKRQTTEVIAREVRNLTPRAPSQGQGDQPPLPDYNPGEPSTGGNPPF